MKVMNGYSYTHVISNTTHLDVSLFPEKYITNVSMGLWQDGNPSALNTTECNYVNWNLFMPLKLAEKIAKNSLNKQSQKTAGVNLV